MRRKILVVVVTFSLFGWFTLLFPPRFEATPTTTLHVTTLAKEAKQAITWSD